ncbi:MAG: hypothetical protein NZ866_01260 [Patescibacteria group bacterium]|nr:hypothetical protein [Patescibacteria group bacterium]
MRNKEDLLFNLILIFLIWISWLLVISLFNFNQIVYYYKPYPEKILLSSKEILYLYPLAFSLLIVYNSILIYLSFNKKILNLINFIIFLFNFFILFRIFFINY